jgi:hypothetical protein
MKKFIYILLIILISGITLTSCTKEEVKPQETINTGGGIKE